ncbi:MAG: tRNA (adenosine(37)-N6)-dimethylallyltransferase MiaA [Candidatus Phaeomarinobacter sp.]
MTPDRRRVLLIAGPTASGKSAVALDVAGRVHGEIINADSMQVYRDLRILSARPSVDDEGALPRHLYGFMDASTACSAAHWARIAVQEIEAVWTRGHLPIVVGGTGLYFKALTEGLSAIPDIPGINREAARVFVEELGPEQAHAHLADRDPRTAAGLKPTDPQRIARALEVLAATGRGLADWQDAPAKPVLTADFVKVVLTPKKSDLTERSDSRFEQMVEQEALDEVDRLMARNLDSDLPIMKAVGVPPLMAHLRGDISLKEAVAQGLGQTRRYIKRQLTWARTQMVSWNHISTQQSKRKRKEILSLLSDQA